MNRFGCEKSWFPKARFGMFAHFGLYTLLGGNENTVRSTTSKSDYKALMKSFNPKKFDAAEWVGLAIEAGAKYLVPTVKHAEGFCLWDSNVTEIKATNTPFRRDMLKELSAACQEKKLRLGVYYNCETWLNEGDDIWNKRRMAYADFVEEQIRELMTGYGMISVLWFDHSDPRLSPARMKKIIQMVNKLQPECVVNNRGVNPNTCGKLLGDYITPERFIPTCVEDRHPFVECCDAIGVKSWGYCKEESFWSAAELITRLSACAASGFNYLLNVEPEPSGRIRPECSERMRAVGAWIGKNKVAMDADPCPLIPVDLGVLDRPSLGRATGSGNTLFVHLHRAPKSDEILIPGIGGNVKCATILSSGRQLRTSSLGDDLIIANIPPSSGAEPFVIKVCLKGALRRLARRQTYNSVMEPLPGGTIHLTYATAALTAANGVCVHAVYPRVNKLGEDRTAICNMLHVGDQLSWKIKLRGKGCYDVFVEIGCVESQSEATFMLKANGIDQIEGITWVTGGCDIPGAKLIGRIELADGASELALKVCNMPHGMFPDVYSITLAPCGK